MSYNRIAVYGHRGWASSAIVDALAASGAFVRVLHRPGSDVSKLPSDVATVEVDIEGDQTGLVSALQDVDILISLVGLQGPDKQYALIRAIPQTNVKIFCPSDMGLLLDDQGMRIPVLRAKYEIEKAARDAGIATTVILPSTLVESGLAVPLLGIDDKNNRIIFTGNSEHEQLNLCSLAYVAAAYAAIFSRTPPSQLANRAIGLSELQATGAEVAAALEKKHGAPPQVFRHSLDKVDGEIESCLAGGSPLALPWYCRRVWGAGQHVASIGKDVWEVEGFEKQTLEQLLVEGKLENYRNMPPQHLAALDATFD